MRGRIRSAALVALATLTPMSVPPSAEAQQACPGARRRPSRANLTKVTSATLCLVNFVRHAHHLGPYRINRALRSIAHRQSHDMLVGGYFSDNSLTGRTPLQRVAASPFGRGASRLSVSQNIAWGTGGEATPVAIVRSWMTSPPHRAILLARGYSAAGIGVGLGTPQRSRRRHGAVYTLDVAAR
jgi:uncharacterized protein YkwD